MIEKEGKHDERKFKKWMALMLSTTMLAACMTGCGSEEKEAASKNEPAKEEAAVETQRWQKKPAVIRQPMVPSSLMM